MATPTPTASAELISIRQCDWLISKAHHVWRLRPWGQVCVLPSDQNDQAGHFLFCFFFFFLSFPPDVCFLLPRTWMATIFYISQLLCLFVGFGDNGAVFLNAQVVSLSFLSFLTFPTSSSPLHPSSHLTSPPRASPVLPALHSVSLISSPLFYLPSPFLPLYLAISLTTCPFSLSPFSPSLVCRQLRDWAQKHPIHHPALHPP